MRFANEYDIAEFLRRADDPVRKAAAQTLANLAEWANRNSDGWAYWPKPARAANRLIEFLESGDSSLVVYRAALRPVKAFRTRATSGAFGRITDTFEIVEDPEGGCC